MSLSVARVILGERRYVRGQPICLLNILRAAAFWFPGCMCPCIITLWGSRGGEIGKCLSSKRALCMVDGGICCAACTHRSRVHGKLLPQDPEVRAVWQRVLWRAESWPAPGAAGGRRRPLRILHLKNIWLARIGVVCRTVWWHA